MLPLRGNGPGQLRKRVSEQLGVRAIVCMPAVTS